MSTSTKTTNLTKTQKARNNIQKSKEEFLNNSLKIKSGMYLLKRHDSFNFTISTSKINKNTKEPYENILGYYGYLYDALISLFIRITNKYPRVEAFTDYFFINPSLGVSDLEKSVKAEFNKEIKLSKTKGYLPIKIIKNKEVLKIIKSKSNSKLKTTKREV